MGWGGFLDQLFDKLPIQGRIERWKNKIDQLEKEKRQIESLNLDINKKEDRKKAIRLSVIYRELDKYNKLLKNKAQ